MRSKEEYRKLILIMGIKLLHFILTIAIFFFFWILFRYGQLIPERDLEFQYNYFTVFGFSAILLFFNRTYNSYLLGYLRIRELAFAEALSQLFATVVIYFAVSITWHEWKSPQWFIVMMIAYCGLDILWSYFGNGYYFRLYPAKKTILIYRNKQDKRRFGSIKGKPTERLYTIAEEYMFDGKFSDIRDKLADYEAVFVAGVNSRCRNGILKYCKENNIPGFFIPHVGDVIMQESIHIQSFNSPVLYVTRSVIKPEYRMIKRGFDFIASLVALIILSPIMLLIALAIKLYDGGPVIYRQIRLTQHGREFRIWKFRSMRTDAEKDGVARLSTGDKDDRITPIGR